MIETITTDHSPMLADVLGPWGEAGEFPVVSERMLVAPMPGTVIRVAVEPGQSVQKGAALVVVEAMKMEHTVTAPRDGTVARVLFAAGDLVDEGAELLVLEEAG